jgi:uncharacterized damage-inducible protein DinB
MKIFRDQGAIGALLDEYEKALTELKEVLRRISEEELRRVIDPMAADEDCRSIQTILTHVVAAGYNYAICIRKHQGEDLAYQEKVALDGIEEYLAALDAMFAYNVQLFADYPDLVMEVLDNDQKMLTRWGQTTDPDQLMEHAIVHILRHRRQIERFLLKMRSREK